MVIGVTVMKRIVVGSTPGEASPIITGPPNGLALFCSLASVGVVVVCNAAGRPGAWAVGRPTLQGGPVRLRAVRTTPCFTWDILIELRTLHLFRYIW